MSGPTCLPPSTQLKPPNRAGPPAVSSAHALARRQLQQDAINPVTTNQIPARKTSLSAFLTRVIEGEEEVPDIEDILNDVKASVEFHWYHKCFLMALLIQGVHQAQSKGGINILMNF